MDSSQQILLQLEEAVNKFNEDTSGQEKLIEKAKRKFDNKCAWAYCLAHTNKISRIDHNFG